jgi:hypothetical protein
MAARCPRNLTRGAYKTIIAIARGCGIPEPLYSVELAALGLGVADGAPRRFEEECGGRATAWRIPPQVEGSAGRLAVFLVFQIRVQLFCFVSARAAVFPATCGAARQEKIIAMNAATAESASIAGAIHFFDTVQLIQLFRKNVACRIATESQKIIAAKAMIIAAARHI